MKYVVNAFQEAAGQDSLQELQNGEKENKDDYENEPLKKQISSISDINLGIHAHHSSYDPDIIMPRLSKISALPDLSLKLKPFKSIYIN